MIARKDLENWSIKQLREEKKSLEEVIYKIECFGKSDLWLLTWVNEELIRRKYDKKR